MVNCTCTSCTLLKIFNIYGTAEPRCLVVSCVQYGENLWSDQRSEPTSGHPRSAPVFLSVALSFSLYSQVQCLSLKNIPILENFIDIVVHWKV
jgi:hypothetical protein